MIIFTKALFILLINEINKTVKLKIIEKPKDGIELLTDDEKNGIEIDL